MLTLDALMLDDKTRGELWQRLVEAIESYLNGVGEARVAPALDFDAIRGALARFDFERPVAPLEALDFAVESLWRWQVHTPHPRYFGLFNPAPATMGIAGDALVAAFNPQLAAWSHSPMAAEIEQHLIRALGERFGFDPARMEGTFTSGGAEANHTALLTALTRAFPEIGRRGLLALRSQPVLYVSPEAHHSFLKAARLSGLGTEAVREVRVDSALRMSPERPRRPASRRTAPRGCSPVPGGRHRRARPARARSIRSHEIAQVADDAGGSGSTSTRPGAGRRRWCRSCGRCSPASRAPTRSPSTPTSGSRCRWARGCTSPATRASSSAPSGWRPATCRATGSVLPVADPYAHSMQWSRRFIGLKLFLSLAVAGWEGYEEAIRRQTAMGEPPARAAAGGGVGDRQRHAAAGGLLRRLPAGRGARRAFLEAVAADVVGLGRGLDQHRGAGGGGARPAGLHHQLPDGAGGRRRPRRGPRQGAVAAGRGG